MTVAAAVKELIRACGDRGITLVVRNNSVTTKSVYLKFEDARLRSVRVSDHSGRTKYKYKWNLHPEVTQHLRVTDSGIRRFFYAFTEIEEMADRIRKYMDTIERTSQ